MIEEIEKQYIHSLLGAICESIKILEERIEKLEGKK